METRQAYAARAAVDSVGYPQGASLATQRAVSPCHSDGVRPQRHHPNHHDRPAPHQPFIRPPQTEPTKDHLISRIQSLGHSVAASHLTAWRLHSLPVPTELDDGKIHVSTKTQANRIRVRGIRCFRRHDNIECEHDSNIWVTSQRQTWIDLAMLQPPLTTLVACGDALVNRTPEMVDVLRHFAAEAYRAKGIRLARQAARLIRPGAESFKETEVRLMLHHAGLPEPELNPALTDKEGQFLGRCDLVYRRARLAIEYEGRHHWQEPGRFRKDLDRVNRLQAHGWRVIRLTQQDLDETTPRWIDDVRQHLATGIPQATR